MEDPEDRALGRDPPADPEDEVLDAEVVHAGGGRFEPRRPEAREIPLAGLRGLAVRGAVSVVLWILGALSLAVGAVLALTIVAAPLGLGLLLVGAALLAAGALILLGGGRMRVVARRGGRLE